MRLWPGHGDYRTLSEWQKTDAFAASLNEACASLNLPADREWLLEILREHAEHMPASIIEGQQSEYLAEYILGLSAARNALVVASYCFRFLKGQGLIPAEQADSGDAKLEELEVELASVTETLRANLASGQGQHSNN